MHNFIIKWTQKKEAIALPLMLASLHIAIWLDFSSAISRSFMLSHLGLFLIWQPLWHGTEKPSTKNIILFLIFTTALLSWLNLWVLFAWLILLIGLIGGRITLNRGERAIYILAMLFLILELLFFCVPSLAKIDIQFHHQWLLLAIPLLMMIVSTTTTAIHYQVDLIHALTTSMLTSLVGLGSLLNMFINQTTYFTALIQTSLAIGGFIICITWLLTSRYRASGIKQLWLNYILNIGTPFEQWLSDLATINEHEPNLATFLQRSMQQLLTLSWVAGVGWQHQQTKHHIGTKTKYDNTFIHEQLNVYIYTYSTPSMALKLHSHLLVKLLYNFYLNKINEQELMQQAQLKAIHETGARVTHDIKNTLQSLHALTNIIGNDRNHQKLLQKQLPVLSQRLQLTLDKLQKSDDHHHKIELQQWWQELQKRYAHHDNIAFQLEQLQPRLIPLELFDSVVDNLLENARLKTINGQAVDIVIKLISETDVIHLNVTDTGEKIASQIALLLFSNIIKSDTGFGVGLYQLSKQARQLGFRLKLKRNEKACVCFELTDSPVTIF